MVLNRQNRVVIHLPALRSFMKGLRSAFGLASEDFNVCIVDDREIERLNTVHRGKPRPTDVLSFPWEEAETRNWKLETRNGKSEIREAKLGPTITSFQFPVSNSPFRSPEEQLAGFLGDVVISAETAGRNAQAEGHSAQNEICRLILHGLLHLVGYDHETDQGEMTAVELALRHRLGIGGDRARTKARGNRLNTGEHRERRAPHKAKQVKRSNGRKQN